jgi:hypothetical protein
MLQKYAFKLVTQDSNNFLIKKNKIACFLNLKAVIKTPAFLFVNNIAKSVPKNLFDIKLYKILI